MWPENWRAVELFLGCAQDWQVVSVGMAGMRYLGIPSVAFESVARRLPPAPGIEVPEDRVLFGQLELLQGEARHLLNARR